MNSTMKLVRSVVGRTAATFVLGGAAMLSTGCANDKPVWYDLFKNSFATPEKMEEFAINSLKQYVASSQTIEEADWSEKLENRLAKFTTGTHSGIDSLLAVQAFTDAGVVKADTVSKCLEKLLKHSLFVKFDKGTKENFGGAADNKPKSKALLEKYHIKPEHANSKDDGKKSFDKAEEYVAEMMYAENADDKAKDDAIKKIEDKVDNVIRQDVPKEVFKKIEKKQIAN